MISTIDKYVPFEKVSDDDLLKAKLFHQTRLGESGCWLWIGTKRKGYGLFNVGSKSRSAHRVSYEVFIGQIPHGMVLCHACDEPSCINPSHLRVGTMKDNMADREARRRRCVRGEQIGTSKLTYDDVVKIRSSAVPTAVLADQHGVDYQTIWKIRKGISWKHVSEETVSGN